MDTPSPSVPSTEMSAAAVRLADEGVPVRAIARATAIPSSDIYDLLHNAILQGQIIELPRDDWPIGSSRTARTAFNGTPLEQDKQLRVACSRFFKASPTEAALIALMLKRNEVTKAQLHTTIQQCRPATKSDETDPKMVDVMICKMRKKLRPHDIQIETMWAVGYRITPSHRERAIALLLADATGG